MNTQGSLLTLEPETVELVVMTADSHQAPRATETPAALTSCWLLYYLMLAQATSVLLLMSANARAKTKHL